MKPLVVAAVAVFAVVIIGFFAMPMSRGSAAGRGSGANDALARIEEATGALSSLQGGSGASDCDEVIEVFDELADAYESFMDDPDTARSMIDGRWQATIGPRYLAFYGEFTTASRRVLRDLEARGLCDEAAEQRLVAPMQRMMTAMGKKDELLSKAVMEKVILDTREQQERERLGIPEPTPYSCRWCGRPMTTSQYLVSLYCSPKCQTEGEGR